MTSPWNGVTVWLWNLDHSDSGDPARIVARLQANGCSGALIKVADAAHPFGDWKAIQTLVNALRAAGLTALGWQYVYGADPAGEARIGVEAQSLLLDGYVFDVEAEFEALARPDLAAQQLLTAFRAGAPTVPLGYAPLPAIAYHLRLPYKQFTDMGCVMLPQAYYVALGWTPQRTFNQFYSAAHQYQLDGPPICPAWMDCPTTPGLGSSAEDVAAFVGLARYCQNPGISVWSYEGLDDAGWARVREAAQLFAGPVDDGECAKRLAAVTAERDHLKAVIAAAERDLST